MAKLTPEQQAREKIDDLLAAAGWVIQDYKALNLSAGRGIALREVPLKSGRCDYLLVVDRVPAGVIEAKKAGVTLSTVADQSGHYAENLPDFLATLAPGKLPFLYESTGVETFFRDERDPDPRSRHLFAFHRPDTLAEWLAEAKPLRARLAKLPKAHPLAKGGMRDCQFEAHTALEASFAHNHPRSLVQMATGAGKTFLACGLAYRLIRYANARRVLFLVDRSNLGRQAKSEFDQFATPETGRKFTELYNVQHLTSNKLDGVARVTICTIQRLYSMLRGEELPEDADELSTYEIGLADGRPKEVAYNPAIPIETFDFIVTDECHRSIYNLWRQVLEYFDAFLVGLTATPSKQTIGFFNQNLVTEYNHERAVADGVNVGYEVYRIRTQVTEQGGKVDKGFYVDKRSKLDRSRRWEQLDEDLNYTAQELDRSVVVPSQIRTVLQGFKDALFTELFPGRTLIPKTLIFCKDDSHAEDVVHLCREVFGKGNDFAKKITYQAKHQETGKPAKCEELIQQFRTSPQLRIAVTVDMIATGTDIKPLECLLFLRDVRSRVYFEQMKGRGTRVLSPTDLQAVSGEDARVKTHFVIVDAVGVCESDKTDSRPLERQPTLSFDKVMLGVAMGKRDEDTLTTLAGRLARLERQLDHKGAAAVSGLTGGKTLGQLSRALLDAMNPDEVEAASRRLALSEEQQQAAELAHFFNPLAPVQITAANLPHWNQDGVVYFVTFRLVDSLPSEKLEGWRREREQWLAQHPLPLSEADQEDYHQRFSGCIENWLDQGTGSCVLGIPECRAIVESALRHFDGQRYRLGEFVVAANHVHALVTPLPGHELPEVLHSWKSFTAKAILKLEAAAHRLSGFWDQLHARRREAGLQTTGEYPALSVQRPVWQKESYDHLVRSQAALQRIERYIREHAEWDEKRRDAASTLLERTRKQLITQACLPFDQPALREALAKAKKEAEQTIDTVTADALLFQGFDAAAKDKAAQLVKTFRDYIQQHQAEIAALQILYSRPYRQRLTEPMLKELEEKLRTQHAALTEDNLWSAYSAAAPGKVKGRSQAGRFADLVSLVRFALKQQPVLKPFAESVTERFNEWLASKQGGSGVPPLAGSPQSDSGVPPLASAPASTGSDEASGVVGEGKRQDAASTLGQNEKRRDAASTFSPEQLAWLGLIRDQIATTLSMEAEDFEYAPFAQQGGLGKAHQLFGERLPELLDELNQTLAA